MSDDRRAEAKARADALLGAEDDSLAQAIAQAIIAFVDAADWDAAEAVLHNRPELLSDEADVIFAGVVASAEEHAAGDEAAVEGLRQHRRVLQWCRAENIEAAIRRAKEGKVQEG